MRESGWSTLLHVYAEDHRTIRKINKASRKKRVGSRWPRVANSKKAYKRDANRKARRMLNRGEISSNAEYNKVRDLLFLIS